jgi:nucleoid DNA-binding protein
MGGQVATYVAGSDDRNAAHSRQLYRVWKGVHKSMEFFLPSQCAEDNDFVEYEKASIFPEPLDRVIGSSRMKKTRIAKYLARHENTSIAEAADRLDQLVHQLLVKLRHGEEATWPGLGVFRPDPETGIRFERSPRRKPARKEAKR